MVKFNWFKHEASVGFHSNCISQAHRACYRRPIGPVSGLYRACDIQAQWACVGPVSAGPSQAHRQAHRQAHMGLYMGLQWACDIGNRTGPVLSVACLGERVKLKLISFVLTVLEGETSVVEIPRKRGICGWFSGILVAVWVRDWSWSAP